MGTDVLLEQLLSQPAPLARRVHDRAGRVLLDLWLGGVPLARAAAAAGLSLTAAEERLRCLGYEGRRSERRPGPRPAPEPPPAPPPRRRQLALRSDIVRLYEEGHSIRTIAAELRMHQRTVWRELDAACVVRRPRGTPGVALSRRALERLYLQERLSMADVARHFEVSVEVVARNLDRYGLPRRDRRASLDPAMLRRLYVDERLGTRAVATRLGVSSERVRAELTRYGIPIRRPGRPARTGS